MSIAFSDKDLIEKVGGKLSKKTYNALAYSSIKTIKDFFDLNKLSDREILMFPRFEESIVKEIRYIHKRMQPDGSLIELDDKPKKTDKKTELQEKMLTTDQSWIFNKKNQKISIFYSIEYLGLDLRYTNALYQNKVFTIKDLILFDDLPLSKKRSYKGIGKMVISGINDIVKNMLSHNMEEHNIDIKYFIKNADYLTLFNVNSFDSEAFLLNFLKNRDEVEIGLLKHRFLFLGNNDFKTRKELTKKYDLTSQRIAQIEEILKENLENYIKIFFTSEVGDILIKSILKNYKDQNCFIYGEKGSGVDDFGINANFLAFYIKKALKGQYISIDLNEEEPINKVLLINKDIVNKKILKSIITTIDEIYFQERKERSVVGINNTILQAINNNGLDEETIFKEYENTYYEDILKTYALEKYGLGNKYGSILFPLNKRNFTFLTIQELKLLKKPAHYRELNKRLSIKYPEYDWKELSTLSILGQDPNAINVGEGTYVYKTKYNSHLGGSIADIAERFLLQKEDKRASLDEVVVYVKSNKKVTRQSVITMIFGMDKKNRFVKLKNNRVGLSKYDYPDIIKKW